MLKPNSILFVCAENICRSPTMEGILKSIFQKKGIDVNIESCGIYDDYLGCPPDKEMQKLAKGYGVTLENKAKIFKQSFFDEFDLIFCVTETILDNIKKRVSKNKNHSKLYLATQFSKAYHCLDVPDPSINNKEEYEKSWKIMEESCQCIIEKFYP